MSFINLISFNDPLLRHLSNSLCIILNNFLSFTNKKIILLHSSFIAEIPNEAIRSMLSKKSLIEFEFCSGKTVLNVMK